MQATFLLLTYPTHINKDYFRDIFPVITKWENLGAMAIAHETGDENCPYLHTHVVAHLGKNRSISKKRVKNGFDIDDIHPNVKILKGKIAYNDALVYISKEDQDIGVELEDANAFALTVNQIRECETEIEVVSMCKKSCDVIPYLTIYRLAEMEARHIEYNESFREAELYPEQARWLKHLERQDDRKITWVCDYAGGKGKSWFGKWLRVNKCAERMKLSQKAVNFMYKGSEYVYINITRTMEEFVSYGALEDLKDGDMVSDKYQGRSDLFASPKLIVFANFYPNVDACTCDRWDIITYGTADDPYEESDF